MKWKLSPRTVSLLIVFWTFLSVLLLQRIGLLQFLEFKAYDFFIRQQPLLANADPMVLVEMTEADIQSPELDYPITDQKLAELFEKLEMDQPAVIGLDIWHELPVPKDKVHLQELNDVLLKHTNIVCIYTIDPDLPIAPPPVLEPFPDRVGFNDNFPVDNGVERTTRKGRRCILFTKAESGQRLESLPFRVACLYLEQRGIKPQFDAVNPDEIHVIQLGKAQIRTLRPNDGPYVGADTRSKQMLLDFKHPSEFTRYSVGDALAGKIPAGSLRGKIVLIAMNAQSVSDELSTPIRYNHLGVERQSLAILQLLRAALDGEKPLRFWPDWQEDLWMLGWCILGGAIGYRIRSPWRFALAILAGLLVLAIISWRGFMAGWWIPLMYPAAAFLPSWALVTSYISFQEHRSRGQLMKLFANQVSPDIAEALWEQRDAFLAGNRPRSQKLTATVLFTDLKGFSTTSEGLEPGPLLDWLNEYMEVMANAVMAHDGVVEKYIGDSIMAVFGVPVPRTAPEQIARDATNAVRCALAMRREMENLNLLWVQRGLPACSTRIGIHTGSVVAGSLGSLDRQEYTVIGDNVNTASRLESFGKDSEDPYLRDDDKCRILISGPTQAVLDGAFELHQVGTMSLKGKAEKVMIYAVLGESKPEPKKHHE
jgi:adenylate cyclase